MSHTNGQVRGRRAPLADTAVSCADVTAGRRIGRNSSPGGSRLGDHGNFPPACALATLCPFLVRWAHDNHNPKVPAGYLGPVAVDSKFTTTYTYIVERTQSYLIEARYGPDRDTDRVREALRATAGLWSDRTESGEAYVERLRGGRRLRDLYPADDYR